jgi:hypothetical protein
VSAAAASAACQSQSVAYPLAALAGDKRRKCGRDQAIEEETRGDRRRIRRMTGKPFLVWICLPFVAATGDGPPPATEGLRSYFRTRELLDAGVKVMGGLDALKETRTVRRRMCGEWIGSGQHPRPHQVAAPTLTAPPANGRDCLTSHAAF